MPTSIGDIPEVVKRPDGDGRPGVGLVRGVGFVEAPEFPADLAVIPPDPLPTGDAVLGVLAPVEVAPSAVGFPDHHLQRQRSLRPDPLGFLRGGEGELPDDMLALAVFLGQDKLPADKLAVVRTEGGPRNREGEWGRGGHYFILP
jgi:hypothetical protein